MPAEPDRLHESHEPLHAVPQHTPLAQTPERHWSVAVHAIPLACWGMHLPAEQYDPLAQLASTVHEAGQDVEAPSQTYGLQVGAPALPIGVTEHVPNLPERSQRSQPDPQAESQQ